MIVEESLLSGARVSNRGDGPWSFRHTVEELAPNDDDAPSLVYEWLREWGRIETFNGFPVNQEPREGGMNNVLLCPWLKRTSGSNCTPDCSSCDITRLDLGEAPFRPIAIVFRPDLATQPDVRHAGEGRIIYALTDGPADDPASKALPMTIILEYFLPVSRPVKEWASMWHHLGTHAAFDEGYASELEALTRAFTDRGTTPGNPNGSSLNQVRTNESALNWIWQLREFRLDRGRLAPHGARNTPGRALNNSPVLRDWITSNADAVRAGKHVMPESMLGGSADQFVFTWQADGIDSETRRQFIAGTCNGCHSQVETPVDLAFHISPFKQGVAKLSRFMLDPQAPDDEARRRTAVVRKMLCDAPLD